MKDSDKDDLKQPLRRDPNSNPNHCPNLFVRAHKIPKDNSDSKGLIYLEFKTSAATFH